MTRLLHICIIFIIFMLLLEYSYDNEQNCCFSNVFLRWQYNVAKMHDYHQYVENCAS